MQFKLFTIPAGGCYLTEEELNKFLRSHRILHVDRTFNPSNGGYWTFCVEYMDIASLASVSSKKDDSDPTEGLSDEEKKRYDRYVEIRLGLSREKNIKAYNIFSNKELARIAKLPVLDKSVTAVKDVPQNKIDDFLPFFYTDKIEDAQESELSEGTDTPF